MKRIWIILGIILAILLTLSLTKDIIAKIAFEKGVKNVTGLEIRVDRLGLGIVTTNIAIANLKLFNPPEFADKVMMYMPEIYVDYDLGALMAKKLHLYEARIHLKEFNVIKNKDGSVNINTLKVVKAQKEGKKMPEEERGALPLRIDKLHFKADKVIYKDYSAGDEPFVKEFDIAIDETYTDVDNPQEVVSLIVTKALIKTTIDQFIDINLDALEEIARQQLEGAKTKALEKAQEVIQQKLIDILKSPY